jgi:Domain of unknown function (DUF4249)
MKKYFLYILGLCFATSFIACDEESFSPITEVEIPAHTARLLIRADWTAGSDSLAIFVSKSRGTLDKTPYNYFGSYDTIANSKVELLRNGQLLGTIPYFGKGYHYRKGLFKLDSLAGTVYTIRVSAPNLETVEASQTIQNPFVVLRGSFRQDGAVLTDPTDPFSSPRKGDELNFELQDNGSDENYYSVESNSQFGGGSSITIFRDTLNKTFWTSTYLQDLDPSSENNILPDRAFNGKNYIWRFWVSNSLYFYNNIGGGLSNFQSRLKTRDRFNFRVRSVNKDFIQFAKSLDLAYNANDNPFFTEPVILYSNVKKGYGIFTISRVQSINFVIP